MAADCKVWCHWPLWFLVAACVEPPAAAPPSLPVKAELTGCHLVKRSGVCVIKPGQLLKVMVQSVNGARLEMRLHGATLSTVESVAESGVTLDVPVKEPHGLLSVEVFKDGARGSWTGMIEPWTPVPLLEQAAQLRTQGKHAEAHDLLVQGLNGLGVEERALATGIMARAVLAQGRFAEAAQLFRQAMALDQQAGLVSMEVVDGVALSFVLSSRLRAFAEARKVLERVAACTADFPEGRARLAYYQGVLAVETGDARTALKHLAQARTLAQTLGMQTLLSDALEMQAATLLMLGRHAEAATLVLESRAQGTENQPACRRADWLNNAGWLLLLAREVNARIPVDGAQPEPDGEPLLQQALALYQTECQDPPRLANTTVNLALAAVQRGDGAQAKRLLDAVMAAPQGIPPWLMLWWLDVAGRAELLLGHPGKALEWYTRLTQEALQLQSPEARWRAALGRALSLQALGRWKAALAAHASAEEILDSLVMLVPVNQGRGSFVSDRLSGTQEHLRLLLQHGKERDAWNLVHRARMRALKPLVLAQRLELLGGEQRQQWEDAWARYQEARDGMEQAQQAQWQLSKAELAQRAKEQATKEAQAQGALDDALAVLESRAGFKAFHAPVPQDGEVVLTFFPLREGWMGAASSAGGLMVRELGEVTADATPAQLSNQLLRPFATALAGAAYVRILPAGWLHTVDFHALPWDGEVLLHHLPVLYGLGLPGLPSVDGDAATQGALVVGNPALDLPNAAREATAMAQNLTDSGTTQVQLLLGDHATRSVVQQALSRNALFFYAGHGTFAGQDGFSSRLVLAGGGELNVGDILGGAKVPGAVFLCACETGRSSGEAPTQGLGLAHAFLLSGSRWVVGSTRPLAEHHVLLAGQEAQTAGQWSRANAVQAARLLRQVQLDARRRSADVDWAAYRLLVP